MNLTTMTPPEIDTILADATEAKIKAESRYGYAIDELHRLAGDTRDGDRWHGPWKIPADKLVAALLDRPASARIDAARAEAWKLRNEVKVSADIIDQCQAEWVRRGRWSRFFLVKNNNGHIHSSTACSTCFVTTHFGWLPQLSGLTEADAVADQGEILCSICFPSAPVAWTNGVSRADKEARAARDAVKAERAAKKAAKALLPDGGVLTVPIGPRFADQPDGPMRSDRFETLHAAKMWLTDEAEWNAHRSDGSLHPSFPASAKQIVAEAVAAKTGETVAEVLEAARKRAAKRS